MLELREQVCAALRVGLDCRVWTCPESTDGRLRPAACLSERQARPAPMPPSAAAHLAAAPKPAATLHDSNPRPLRFTLDRLGFRY